LRLWSEDDEKKEMIDLLEITDFIGGLLIQLANYLKVRKIAFGWLITALTIIYWFFRVSSIGFVSQSFWHIFSFIIAVHGYITWTKQNEKY